MVTNVFALLNILSDNSKYYNNCLSIVIAIVMSSHVSTESSIILAKYFPFWQLHIAGFQI